jgi:hypothetical protein
LYSYFSLPTEVRVRARLATSGEDSKNPAPGNGCGVFLWPWMAGMPEMQEQFPAWRWMASEALGLLPGVCREFRSNFRQMRKARDKGS